MTPLSEEQERESFCGVGVRNNGTGWLFSLSPLLALSMSCALCPTPFAQQHLKLLGPPNSGRSVAEWAPSLKRATDACVLASNNASPAQRGPRRDAQSLQRKKERKQTRQTRDGTRTGSPPARAGFWKNDQGDRWGSPAPDKKHKRHDRLARSAVHGGLPTPLAVSSHDLSLAQAH